MAVVYVLHMKGAQVLSDPIDTIEPDRFADTIQGCSKWLGQSGFGWITFSYWEFTKDQDTLIGQLVCYSNRTVQHSNRAK